MINTLQTEPGKLTENFLGAVGFSFLELRLPFMKGFTGLLPIALFNSGQEEYLSRFGQWAEKQKLTTLYLGYGIQRTPGFKFRDSDEAQEFISWLADNQDGFQAVLVGKSKHLKYLGYELLTCQNPVLVCLNFDTGDASGQNMVTLAAQRFIDWVKLKSPIKYQTAWIDPNASGDKKPAALTKINGRGGKCLVEWISPNLLPEEWNRLELFRNRCLIEQPLSANAIDAYAGLLLAFGQDLACLAESGGQGIFAINSKNQTVSCVYNNLIWGTIGGGTRLPAVQKNFQTYFGGTPSKKELIEVVSGFLFLLSVYDALEQIGG